MIYQLKEIIPMFQIYHQLESLAKDFLFISASAMKNKEHAIKSAQKVIVAIEQYKTIPSEVRKELEKDKSASVSNIDNLEKSCRLALAKNK